MLFLKSTLLSYQIGLPISRLRAPSPVVSGLMGLKIRVPGINAEILEFTTGLICQSIPPAVAQVWFDILWLIALTHCRCHALFEAWRTTAACKSWTASLKTRAERSSGNKITNLILIVRIVNQVLVKSKNLNRLNLDVLKSFQMHTKNKGNTRYLM